MKIALVAPSGVPFVVGGAEKLWWGLTDQINQHSPHDLELIKVPAPERTLPEIVESYRRFAALDLSHFDMVISTKYPTWMVSHPNHIVYLQHCLRGLYDTYPAQLPTTPEPLPPAAEALWSLLSRPRLERAVLPELFERLDGLLQGEGLSESEHQALLAFPGPFARGVVQALDRIGLAPEAIRRYLAISHTVARREGYFPAGADIQVVPHPPYLPGLHEGPSECVFTASRLDGPKRLDLLVRAYRQCATGLPLMIAGEGPERERLEELAAGDPRIRFLGRLSDADLADQYARAAFVPFLPYQEDMGLITLEAMGCGKPVLTTQDAGGVTEFVRDGVNGRIVPAEPTALATAIDALASDPAALARMGSAAKETASAVTWTRTIDALLEPAPKAGRPPVRGRTEKTRLLVVGTFGVYPPDSGGRKRIFYLYQGLSARADVTLLNLGDAGRGAEQRHFSPSFREIRIPPDQAFQQADAALHRALRASVTDIAALDHGHAISALASAFEDLAREADVVVASHPYLFPLIERLWSGPIWYDAHNVEADLKADILGVERPSSASAYSAEQGTAAERAVGRVLAAEGRLVREAAQVWAVSEGDAGRLAALYGRDAARITRVPNGVRVQDDPWLESERRSGLKQRLGLDGTPLAVFVGSHHGPNLTAAETVLACARARPDWAFWLAGSICQHQPVRRAPANVRGLGVLDEAALRVVLRAADVGLNPMSQGSGTNLKMLDYAAHGALALSTPVGARGLGLTGGQHYEEADTADFAATLERLAPHCPGPRVEIRTEARKAVEERFSWRAIADTIALTPEPAGD